VVSRDVAGCVEINWAFQNGLPSLNPYSNIETMMKTLIIAITLLVWSAFAGRAQTQTPDALFYITLQSASNAAPASMDVWVEYFYRMSWPPYYPPYHIYTNDLDIQILTSETPGGVWILKKQENGFLKPVLDVTNYDQSFITLTVNDVRSLIAGDLYLEVDFSGSNYLGRFAPLLYPQGPTAVMDFPPLIGNIFSYSGYTIISTNNRTAEAVLDGSHSTDPFYLPIHYSWTGYTTYDWEPSSKVVFKNQNKTAKEVLALGLYSVSLQVSNRLAVGQPYNFYVNVVTPGESIDSFIANFLQGSGLPNGEKRRLTDILTTAKNFFNRGDMAEGCADLEVYKSMVNEFHFNKTETSWLVPPIQIILNAFNNVEDDQLGQLVVPAQD
jgi:hypothetical protein